MVAKDEVLLLRVEMLTSRSSIKKSKPIFVCLVLPVSNTHCEPYDNSGHCLSIDSIGPEINKAL